MILRRAGNTLSALNSKRKSVSSVSKSFGPRLTSLAVCMNGSCFSLRATWIQLGEVIFLVLIKRSCCKNVQRALNLGVVLVTNDEKCPKIGYFLHAEALL